MTPRQRRNHIEALGKAAAAPRKSWLGKSMLLTCIQSAWIKSLLSTWGEGVRGGAAPAYAARACMLERNQKGPLVRQSSGAIYSCS